MPSLDEQGLDLIDKFLKCNPAERITAKQAMLHPYLKDVPDYIKNMKWLNMREYLTYAIYYI